MKRETTVAIKVSENHRRSISITLQLIDQALCEWDDWANGRLQSGIMYRQLDTLSVVQKHELQNKIGKVRQLITRLRDDLDLEPKNVGTARSIAARASLLWEMLTELNEPESNGGKHSARTGCGRMRVSFRNRLKIHLDRHDDDIALRDAFSVESANV